MSSLATGQKNRGAEDLDHFRVLRELARHLKARTYVEIGVDKGEAFLGVACSLKVGVDPYKNMKRRHIVKDRSMSLGMLWAGSTVRKLVQHEVVRFFEMASDAFFANDAASVLSGHPIDLAFVDGKHTYDQALRDVLNCAQYLSPGGFIVVHDCNPTSNGMALPATSWADAQTKNPPDWNGLWCGDVWKTILDLRIRHPEFEVCVLDCDFGVGLVRWSTTRPSPALSFTDPGRLDYNDLQAQRVELLNLKPACHFKAVLESLGPTDSDTYGAIDCDASPTGSCR